MKRRKIMSMFMAAAIAAGSFAGYGIQTVSAEEADEVVTLQWYGAETLPEWQNAYLEEQIGVRIEGIPSDPEKTQAMIAAGNLPDLGYYWNPQRDLTDAILSGGIMDLSPYLDQLPNVTANAPAMIEYMKDCKSAGTGGLYGIGMHQGFYPNSEINTGCYSASVRWDVYKEAGCPEVTDTQSYLECLKKMQEVHPETEDGIKTYGMSMFGEWDGTECTSVNKFLTIEGVLECGIDIGYNVYDIVNEKLVPMLEKDSPYVNALKTLYTANQMGILDPDSMTMKFQDSQIKLENGSVLSAGWGQYAPGWENKFKEDGQPIGWMPLVWEGQHPVMIAETALGTDPLCVSSTTEHLDECLKLINFLFDYDASLTMVNGPKGFLWDVVDGKLVATDTYINNYGTGEDLIMEDGTVYKNTYSNSNPALTKATIHPEYNQTLGMQYWDDVKVLATKDNALLEDWAEFYGAATPVEWLNQHDGIVYRPRAYALLESVPQELKLNQDTIKEVVKEKSWKMVYAKDEAEFDALLEEMVAECEGLGLQDLVTWGQENWAQAEARVEQYYGAE